MTGPKYDDYTIAPEDADVLKGASLLPGHLRRLIIGKMVAEQGVAHIVNLFAQFIGLANSVVANNREMVEMLMIMHNDDHPYAAEKANLPTIFGALSGIGVAAGIDQTVLCEGCAYRIGTAANQSPVTTCDAEWVVKDLGLKFLCHMDGEAEGKHKKACAGFAQARAKFNRQLQIED